MRMKNISFNLEGSFDLEDKLIVRDRIKHLSKVYINCNILASTSSGISFSVTKSWVLVDLLAKSHTDLQILDH